MECREEDISDMDIISIEMMLNYKNCVQVVYKIRVCVCENYCYGNTSMSSIKCFDLC